MTPEEQIMEPSSFAEVNASHQAGDLYAMAVANDGKTETTSSAEETQTSETVSTETTTQEQVNWEEKFKTYESEFTKKEQSHLEKIKEYESKIVEYEKKTPPLQHKDSDLSRLEVVRETAPEKFDLYTKLLFSKPDAAELWKLDFVEKNPDFKDDPTMIEKLLKAEFKDYFGEDADPESDEYKVAEARLRIAGNQIKAAKLAEFNAIQVSDPAVAEQTQKQQKEALAKSWEIPFTELSKNPIKVSQKIALDDKTEVEVDFGLQPEDNKKYSEAMGLFILHNNLKPSAENAEKARNYAVGEIIREKFPEILKAVLQKDRKEQWDAFQKSRNNNRPFAPINTASDDKKSADQSIMEMLEHGEVHIPNS